VYLLASRRNGTLYTGVTNNLIRRVAEHKSGAVEGFTKEYGVHRLVWYESWADISGTIGREKRIKHWRRKWKIQLIEATNPDWDDLFDQVSL
jgi:putative endonuclease